MVNVGDDVTLHGLRICPDLDSVMYTLGGGADPERGWGRAGETWTVKEELAAYGAEPTWFGLGDRDIATHLVRTTMLDAGYPLSAVTEALCDRWQPGVTTAAGHRRPAGDPRRGRPSTASASARSTSRSGGCATAATLPAQPVRLRRRRVGQAGAPACSRRSARPTWSCSRRATRWSASRRSSPCPASARRVVGGPAPVVGVSPIIGGAPVRGMADRCLAALGVECSAAGRRRALRRPRRRRPARRLAGRHRRRRRRRARRHRRGRCRCG